MHEKSVPSHPEEKLFSPFSEDKPIQYPCQNVEKTLRASLKSQAPTQSGRFFIKE